MSELQSLNPDDIREEEGDLLEVREKYLLFMWGSVVK